MNISKTDIDKLNAVVNISIDKKDYEQKVHTILRIKKVQLLQAQH